MARKLDDLIIGLQLRTKALEQGMSEMKRQFNRHSSDVRNTSRSYDELAVVAGVAFYKIVGAVKSGVAAYNEFNNSMVGLRSIAEGTGNSFDKAQKLVDAFTRDGLVPASDAATALKNLLSRGFGMDEAADVLNRLKDAAAFGRQGALSLGEAVKSATEGLKNENSVLVDNAGVTKNVSKMWEEYAAVIGKSVNDLTIAEKRQAEYAGIMKETQHQVGDAAKYAQEFSGAQAKAAAEILKLKQAIGAGMVPVLNTLLNLLTPIISFTTSILQQNPILSSSIIAMAGTMATLTTGAIALASALKILGPAIKSITAAMATNPIIAAITVGLIALVGIITAITGAVQKAKKEQELYNQTLEKYNKIASEGITKAEVPGAREDLQKLKDTVAEYDKLTAAMEQFKQEQDLIDEDKMKWDVNTQGVRAHIYENLREGIEKVKQQFKEMDMTADEARKNIETLEQAIRDASRVTATEFNNEAKTLAQRRNSVIEVQNLIKTYKNAAKGSSEWLSAQGKLAEIFPQYSSNAGIAVEAIESMTAAQDAAVKAEFAALQTKAKLQRIDLENTIKTEQGKVDAIMATIPAIAAEAGYMDSIISKQVAALVDAQNKLNALKADAQALKDFEGIDIDKVTGVKPTSSGSGSGAYQSAYDKAIELYEHRKRLNQLTADEELAALEKISHQYAKSADDKRDMEVRLYEARKAIAERDRQLDEEVISRKTEDAMNMLEDRRTAGELTLEQELTAYDDLIQEHKTYLDKILADERFSADEKRRIQQEEESTVREYERKKYEIKRDYAQKERQDTIDSINRMNDGILDALRNMYEQQQQAQEKALQNELDNLEKWRDASVDNIESVYDLKIKAIKDAAAEQEKALRAEIDALDQSKKEQDRAEIDASELAKIQKLKEKIDYEHNEYNKVQLQKELNKLLEEREKRLYEQQLEDKKDSLESQIDAIKENADQQSEILEQEKDEELSRIEQTYNARRESLDRQLEDLRNFYSAKLNQANLEAEAEIMLMTQTQDQIVTLLQSYGNAYALTGKTLGERLYDGFKTEVDRIKTLWDEVLVQINRTKDEALKAIVEINKVQIPAAQSYGNNAYGSAPAVASNTTINQTLNFNTPTAPSPSETARKNLQASRELALEWS